MKALALLGAYLMIGSGAVLITHAATSAPAAAPYISVRVVRQSAWIERYSAAVALAAHDTYHDERI